MLGTRSAENIVAILSIQALKIKQRGIHPEITMEQILLCL